MFSYFIENLSLKRESKLDNFLNKKIVPSFFVKIYNFFVLFHAVALYKQQFIKSVDIKIIGYYCCLQYIPDELFYKYS